MELIPALKIGWLNGWILICLVYLTYGILLLVFPKDVVARLYDKSGRTKTKIFDLYRKPICFRLFYSDNITPLKFGSIFSSSELFYRAGVYGLNLNISGFNPCL